MIGNDAALSALAAVLAASEEVRRSPLARRRTADGDSLPACSTIISAVDDADAMAKGDGGARCGVGGEGREGEGRDGEGGSRPCSMGWCDATTSTGTVGPVVSSSAETSSAGAASGALLVEQICQRLFRKSGGP